MFEDPFSQYAGFVRRFKAEKKTYFVQVFQHWAIWTVLFEDILGQLIESCHFILCLFNNPLQSTKIAWWSSLVQQVNVDVLWDRKLSLVNGFEDSTLSTAILSQETIPSSKVDLNCRIVDQHLSMKHQTRRCDLDISACLLTGQHSSRHSIRDSILVLLQRQLLDLLVNKLIIRSIPHGWTILARPSITIHRASLRSRGRRLLGRSLEL
jgi:hypothetical protein